MQLTDSNGNIYGPGGLEVTGSNGKPKTIGGVTSVTASAPLVSSGGLTPNLSIPAATSSINGYLLSSDWLIFNSKFNTPTGTTLQYVRGDGSLATFPTIPSITGLVPYTGATGNVDLGNHDLYLAKLWLYDEPVGGYGSVHLTDNVFHVEDTDGHSMVTFEDGFFTIANGATIRALFNISGLTANRDYVFPNTSGTIALTSDIPSLAGYVPTTRTISTTGPLSGGGDLSANRTLSISKATTLVDGYLSAIDWNTFNGKQAALTLTTTGSGAATLIANVLNIPTPAAATFSSLTTTGSSGSSTLSAGVLNVPTYTLSGLGGQPLATNLTSLAGLAYASTSFVKMTAAGTFALDTNTYLTGITSSQVTTALGYTPVTNARTISTTAPLAGGGDLTANRTLSITQANTSTDGYLSSADYRKFNGKFGGFSYGLFIASSPVVPGAGEVYVMYSEGDPYEMRISYTTNDGITLMNNYFINNLVGGNSIIIRNQAGEYCVFTTAGGAIDYGTYCIISVGGYLATTPSSFTNANCYITFPQNPTLATVNGTSLYNNVNIVTGTVTSVAALTIGTTGTNITSTVATGTTTPVITLNVPTASAANRGALSAADWTTFNGKFTLPSLTSGSVLFSDGTTIAQDNTAFNWDNTNKRLNLVSSGDNLLNLTPSSSANAAVINSNGYIKFNAAAVSYIRGFSTATAFAVYNSAYTNIFNIGTSAACYVNTGSNFLIGTTTDSGFKFDDNGTSMFRDTMNFKNTTAMDSAPLGSELATTASGTNWAGTSFATGYTHTTGSVVALTSATLTATGGNFYQIAITITGRTAGSINISIGAVSLLGITATSGYGIKASSTTTTLTVTPTTDFDGTVVLSVKQINTSTASMSWQTSAGTVVNEFRTSSSNNNLFFGTGAGQRNTTGTLNTFIGALAGQSHTSGVSNVFVGFNAGLNTTTGNQNAFVGSYAGQGNVAGTQNTAMGYFSGSNVTGNNNSFYGAYTGQSATGSSNSFFGWQAGSANTSGGSNVCLGFQAGGNNLTGSTNVIIGNQAGRTISGGVTAATVINNSIIIGSNAYPLADSQTNQIVIGYNVVGLGSNTTVLGNSSTTFAAIYGNVGIGTTTDAGFKLDVNGTARVQGNLTLGGTTAIGGGYNVTSGTYNIIQNGINILPTSGTMVVNGFAYTGTINQTGGANGITRGLYINPTLTAAADFRAIEVASGITILGAATTAKASLRIPSGTAPTSPVDGDIWFDGTLLKMRIGGVTKTFTII